MKCYRSTVTMILRDELVYYKINKNELTFTNTTVSRKTSSTLAHVAAFLINALSVWGTHVITGCAFVHVHANRTAVFLV